MSEVRRAELFSSPLAEALATALANAAVHLDKCNYGDAAEQIAVELSTFLDVGNDACVCEHGAQPGHAVGFFGCVFTEDEDYPTVGPGAGEGAPGPDRG